MFSYPPHRSRLGSIGGVDEFYKRHHCLNINGVHNIKNSYQEKTLWTQFQICRHCYRSFNQIQTLRNYIEQWLTLQRELRTQNSAFTCPYFSWHLLSRSSMVSKDNLDGYTWQSSALFVVLELALRLQANIIPRTRQT